MAVCLAYRKLCVKTLTKSFLSSKIKINTFFLCTIKQDTVSKEKLQCRHEENVLKIAYLNRNIFSATFILCIVNIFVCVFKGWRKC